MFAPVEYSQLLWTADDHKKGVYQMGKWRLLIVGLPSALSACASLSESQPLAISPPAANGEQWSISAKAETGNFYDDVKLYVNDTLAASGSLGPASHHGIHIVGDYQHHVVLGVCSRSDSEPVIYDCIMYIDGSEAGTLRF